MMYMSCTDLGNRYMVSSVSKVEPYISVETSTFEITDTKIYAFLVESLVDNKKVYFNKNISQLTLGDFYTQDERGDVFAYKEQTLFALSKFASSRISKITLFDFYRYSYLNTRFTQLGYNLCGDEKEEAYIEILEKNDPEQIALLEDYLCITTRIKKFETLYGDLKNAEEALLQSTTMEQAQSIYDKFVSNYN